MLNRSIGTDELLHQTASLQRQISEMENNYGELIRNISQVSGAVTEIQTNPPDSGMVNLINNGDLSFNDTGYNDATYTDSDDYAAEWYYKTQGTADWLISTLPAGAVSTQALKADAANNSYWNKTAGVAQIGGGDILGQKLAKKYFTGGNRVFVRMQLNKASGATVADDISLKVSFYDNTAGQKKIIEGETLQLTASTQGTTGTFTRRYILKIITATGSFYSDVITLPEVADALSVNDNTDLTANYVQVSWNPVLEEQQYYLYRYDSEFTEWRLIAQITNGSTSFRDSGGRSGELFTPPVTQINPKAQSILTNVGSGLSDIPRDVLFSIRMPSTYNFSVTDEQWFQIEFTKADGTDTTNTEISARGIVIDKIGISLANGKWIPSARDQQTLADVQTTDPPVSTGGGDDGGYIPPDGGGGFGCVVLNAQIMAVDDVSRAVRLVSAKKVYVGMPLIGKDAQGRIKTSKVKRIFKAYTNIIYNIITKSGFVLPCSPTHPIIQTVEDLTGIAVHKIEKLADSGQSDIPVLVSPDGTEFVQDYLLGIESVNMRKEVITFEMEDETMTYIANNILCHNLEYKQQY